MAIGVLQDRPRSPPETSVKPSTRSSRYRRRAPGWNPWFSGDSEVSTPAIADLFGNQNNEVIEGIGTTAGNLFGQQYSQGGQVRVIRQTGISVSATPTAGSIASDH